MEFSEALGIDLGGTRIGIARVASIAKLPEPFTTVIAGETAFAEIQSIVEELSSDVVVVGLPRNLAGEDTDQTLLSREFADTLKPLGIPIVLQDEAVTSKHAEQLIRDGVYKKNARGEAVGIDEVAACLILQDFIGEPRAHV